MFVLMFSMVCGPRFGARWAAAAMPWKRPSAAWRRPAAQLIEFHGISMGISMGTSEGSWDFMVV